MVRIRLYGLFVSLPMLMIIGGFVWQFFDPAGPSFWNAEAIVMAVGAVLQAIFVGAIACPKCGKSPWMFKDSNLFGLPWADAQCSRCGFSLDGRHDNTPK